jgi:D-amino-acid dehydrogenase
MMPRIKALTEATRRMQVLIIGAGAVGVATAHTLLDDGHAVTLVDADGGAARTSGAPSAGNAGWIATADIMPLASPKSLRQALQWLTDPLAPLAIRPRYWLAAAPWLARFLWASRPAAVATSMAALTDLQSRALPAWLDLTRQLGLEAHIHRRGALYLHASAATLDEDRAYAAVQRRAGIEIDVITADEARQLEPALKPGLAGATFHADGAHISDPLALTSALRDAALARGATMRQARAKALIGGERPGVVTDDGTWRADAVVLAAGIWSRPLAATLGDRTPLDTERGYNVSFRGVTGLLHRPVSFVGHGFVATPLDSGLRIGGAVEFAGLEAQPNHARTRALHGKAQRFVDGIPAFDTGEVWMGFRPSLPDSLPVIGPSRQHPRIIHAFGHGHLGMTQSVVTARLVADMIAGRKPAFDASPFRADRF